MSIFRVNVKVDTAKNLLKLKQNFVTNELVQKVKAEIVEAEIKKQIRNGVSPVRGFGRFGEYVNPQNYPGKGKKRLKPQRPVNLFLTGVMLSWFGAFKKSGSSIEIGIDKNAPNDVKVRAKANNLGTERNGTGAIPRRRFIPQTNETWNVTVTRAIKNLFALRLQELFNKK